MTGQSIFEVEFHGIDTVTPVKTPPQGIPPLRDGDKMDVVVHQTISADFQTEPASAFNEQIDVEIPIVVISEDIEAPNPTLSNMVRRTG